MLNSKVVPMTEGRLFPDNLHFKLPNISVMCLFTCQSMALHLIYDINCISLLKGNCIRTWLQETSLGETKTVFLKQIVTLNYFCQTFPFGDGFKHCHHEFRYMQFSQT